LARLSWALIAISVVLVLLELLPVNMRMTYGEWYVQQARPALPSSNSYLGFVRYLTILESAVALLTIGMGLIVFRYKSDDWMGLFVSAVLIMLSLLAISSNIDTWQFPRALASLQFMSHLLRSVVLGGFLLFFYLFPDGRFQPKWTRWPAFLGMLGIVAFTLPPLFLSQEFLEASANDDEWGWLLFVAMLFISMGAALFSQVIHYRTAADPAQRQQMKWVIFGLGAWFSGLLWHFVGGLFLAPGWEPFIGNQLDLITLALIPVSLGFSILRYRLWDVDLLINRSLVYGGLTALVLGLYVAVVGGISSLLQQQAGLLLGALATGLVALLVQPLRARLQRGVNRLMYGERDDPATALSRLGRRLETTASASEILPALVETIAHTLKLPYAAVALRDGETFPIAAEHQETGGGGRSEAEVFPLLFQSEMVGQLLLSPRTGGDSFSPAERRLIQNLARQAGAAVHAAQLTGKLQRSRQRLVTAREEERRRLRRDLHDGLGPQLATLALKVEAARNHLGGEPDRTEGLLVELKAQIQDAIQDVRRLVYELRPPALDQLGLPSALREYVAGQNGHQTLNTVIETPESLPALPAAVEVAAYRIALEALTNVARHAQARNCTVRFRVEDGLHLEITDDGRGLPAHFQAGVGLASMRERAAELGGVCTIENLPGGGTTIRVHLPFAQVEDHNA
jgi:signal transduction histidine kinase